MKDDTGRALDGSEIGDGDIVQIDMQTDVHVEDHARGRHLPLLANAVGRYWTFDALGSILDGFAREKRDIAETFPGAQG